MVSQASSNRARSISTTRQCAQLDYSPKKCPPPPTLQIELESGCGGGGAEVQKKHSERWTEDLFGRGACHNYVQAFKPIHLPADAAPSRLG